MSDSSELYQRLIKRIEALEKHVDQSRDPESQRLDRLIRKVAKSIEMTMWLGGVCLRIAPVIAVLWWAGEEILLTLQLWLENLKGK